jgi:hypothetical protein
MSEREYYAKAFFPVTQRIRAAFAKTLKEESGRALEEGMPDSVVLEGSLNTLLWFAARIACRIIFPAEDPECMEGRERIERIQRALSHALVTVMAEERESTAGRVAHLRAEPREGHA